MQKASITAPIGIFRSKVLVTLLIACNLSVMAPAKAVPDSGSPTQVIIKCFNPKFKAPRLIRVVQGARRFPIAQVASSYGCLWWQVLKQEPFRTPPGVGFGAGGCNPEQVRAMGFKPERGDCNQ
ncbi:hypothetical protein GS682_05775 [Nostoc sp. B(2019)]|nr:hypothetical protein [Nostoc sp. B(2019)]